MADNRLQTARPRCSPVSHREAARTTGPGLFTLPGFSLIELLIVLVIVATASAIAVPRMVDSEARWRVGGAARRIAADIAEARSYAIASSADVTITFSRDGYTVTSARDGVIRSVQIESRPYNAGIIEATFDSVKTLTFDGFGAGSADGYVTTASDGLKCRVVVDAATGMAKVGALELTTVGIEKDLVSGTGSLEK